MKAVLISIKPKWCELIASGKKTVEIRKTKPKLETPFKVYIYCTKNTRKYALHTYINSGYGRKKFGVIGQWRSGKEVVDVNSHLPAYRYNAYLAEGMVIGEFVCDEITPLFNVATTSWSLLFGNVHEYAKSLVRMARLTEEEMLSYAKRKNCYAWRISDLVIYDKPKELSDFTSFCDGVGGEIGCRGCEYYYTESNESIGFYEECCCNNSRPLKRPPQSWCYAEEGSNT